MPVVAPPLKWERQHHQRQFAMAVQTACYAGAAGGARMATEPDATDDPLNDVRVVELTPEQAWDDFDAEVRETLGISAAEFAHRLDAGAYGDPDDDLKIMWLAFAFEGMRSFGFHLR